jgi:hypothetical protein
MTRATILRRLAVVAGLASVPWVASVAFGLVCTVVAVALTVSNLSGCSAAAPACKGAHLANEACDLFMIARPNDAGAEPVSAPELSRFAEEHHKAKLARIVDAGADR